MVWPFQRSGAALVVCASSQSGCSCRCRSPPWVEQPEELPLLSNTTFQKGRLHINRKGAKCFEKLAFYVQLHHLFPVTLVREDYLWVIARRVNLLRLKVIANQIGQEKVKSCLRHRQFDNFQVLQFFQQCAKIRNLRVYFDNFFCNFYFHSLQIILSRKKIKFNKQADEANGYLFLI